MRKFTLAFAMIAVTVLAVGCTPETKPVDDKSDTGKKVDPHEGHDHEAAHAKMPHGGHLIELGRSHEYHAELVDDHKTESITVYILDHEMKELPIKAASISLVLTAGDDTKTFELAAGKADGSSEFTSNDEALMTMIDSGEVTGKLLVTIEGKQFTGVFEHHEHEDDHDDHAKHDDDDKDHDHKDE